MIKYKSNGDWFDEGTIVRLIDDYRPSLDSGLFIGYQNGEIDEEVCGFDEFEEIEVEEMDTELDKAFDFQDNYWKGLERRAIGLKILTSENK